MDIVNKTLAQIVELFNSMTPAARLTAALLAGVIAVSLVFLFQYQTESADDYLLGGRPFTAGELTAVQRALANAKLENWELEGSRIRIPGGQKHIYIAALSEGNALPADFASYMEKAVDGQNPFMSKFEIDLRLKTAKQRELALVISRFHNVDQASVLFDEVEKEGLRRGKLKTASVAVQTNGAGLEEPQVRAIRNLLAASYAGLERSQISITDTSTGVSYSQPGENGDDGESLYAANKLKFESEWRKKIQERLSYIPGAIVGVNVELNPEVHAVTTSLKIDPKPVALKTVENSVESSSSTPVPSGRPGAVPNGVGQQVGNQPQEISSTNSGAKSQQSETKSEQQNIAGHEQRTQRTAGLRPERVTASIGVPASYFVKVWRQLNPTADAAKEPDANELKRIETQENERIKEAIINLLPPVSLGKEPYPLVTVNSFTDIPGTPIKATPFFTTATDWLGSNWRTLGMFGMSFIGLFMLRSMVSGGIKPEPATKSAAESAAHGAADNEHGSGASTAAEAAEDEEEGPEPILKMKRRLSTKGPNLRDELKQLVQEDPDAAANVIRGWIGDAA